MTFLDRSNSLIGDFTQNWSGGKIIKFQQSQALTSHFESFWSIVITIHNILSFLRALSRMYDESTLAWKEMNCCLDFRFCGMCWCHSDIMKRIEEVPHAQFDKQIHEKLNFHGAKKPTLEMLAWKLKLKINKEK